MDLVIVASVVVATRSGMLHRMTSPPGNGPGAASIRVNQVNRRKPCGCVGRSTSSREPAWRPSGAIPGERLTYMASSRGGSRASRGGCLPINRRCLPVGPCPWQLDRHSTRASDATREQPPPDCVIHRSAILINYVTSLTHRPAFFRWYPGWLRTPQVPTRDPVSNPAKTSTNPSVKP